MMRSNFRTLREGLVEMTAPARRILPISVTADLRPIEDGPRIRLADSGVFAQIGSSTFRTRPVSIAETGRSLIAAVAAGNVRLPRFVS
jgi:hypothetical protein